MRGAQPALADRRVRIDGALKHHLLEVRREHAQHDENIGIAGRRRDEKSYGGGPGDFRLMRQRRRKKRDAVAHRVEAEPEFLLGYLGAERTVRRIEIELRPFGALERPLLLATLDEAVGVADLQLHRRLLVPEIRRAA